MGTKSTSGPKPTLARIAEVENAQRAAEDLARRGETDLRCLICGGELVVEEVGTSYLVPSSRRWSFDPTRDGRRTGHRGASGLDEHR
jgi:hypothetical protein